MVYNVFKREIKNNLNYIMSVLLKIVLNMLRRISKLTLMTLLWTMLAVVMLVFIFFCVNPKGDNQAQISPVIVWWTAGFPDTSQMLYCPNNLICNVTGAQEIRHTTNVDAYLFYGSNINFDSLPLPRKPREIIWGLYHEESPRNVQELMHEEVLKLFNYSSTFSRHSDVPFPLQYLDSLEDITSTKYFVPTNIKGRFNISPIMYLQTDCETATERDEYVKELMKYIQIDSYGTCLQNKGMPSEFTEDYLNNLNNDGFLQFIARYKFVLSLENGVCEDYVTEKFWRAIKIGTVPIYFGSPSISDWLPNKKSAILLNDYPSPEIMSKYIKKLLENNSFYETHLEHKTKQLISNKMLLDEIQLRPYQMDALKVAEDFECFICKKIHEKRLGIIEEETVDRKHYDCPKPISALSQQVNPTNSWVFSWHDSEIRAKEIKRWIMN